MELIESMQYAVRKRIIETKAILSGNVIRVLTDDSYLSRITVFEAPDEHSVYYAVQEFTSDLALIKVYESDLFDDIDQMDDDFESLIDITKIFIH